MVTRNGAGRQLRGRAARRAPLLPPALRAFLRQRMVDGGALMMIAIAAALLVAFASYDHADPSRNHATSRPASNLLGTTGSYTADFLLSTLGFAAGLLPATLAIWGALILIRRPLARWWLRVIALMASLVLTATLVSYIPSGLFYSAGGTAGMMVHTALNNALRPVLGIVAPLLIVGGSLLASALLIVAMLGFTLSEWWWAAVGSVNVSKATATGARGLAQSVSEQTMALARRQPAAARAVDDNAEAETAADETPAAKPGRRKAAAMAKKVAPDAKRSPGAPLAAEPDFLSSDEYCLPPVHLLQLAPPIKPGSDLSPESLAATSEALNTVLQDFGIRGEIVRSNPGPVVTLYELEPAPGTKSARVIGLADDIARSLSAVSVRVAVVPGRNVIGIELPNQKRETVYLREILESDVYRQSPAKLTLILGKEIGGQAITADLARMPHLLVAGTTGSGKSVGINTMILSLLYRLSPEQCRFIMIDPKMLELSVYDGIPHLLTPVVTEPKKAVVALKWTVREMEDRYRAMSKLGVRNIEGYNARLREARANGEILTRKVQTGFDPDTGKPIFEDQTIDLVELPYIVVVVDEFADLMLVAGKDIEAAIQRLAQMARAAGIHLIMATQRPSVDVVTGTIKANFPTRISFAVSSKIDSRTILGESGAEQLLGQGDMLYMASGGRIIRVHGPFVRDDEVEQVVAFLKKQGEPSYIEAITEEEMEFSETEGSDSAFGGGDDGGGNDLYDKAVALVAREGKASTSFVQRHFQIGYNKAARLIERMEKEGVVSQANHVGKRDVLVRRTNED
jgi:S-DNA-T family DNA segregation ATPase FtsK/SpoIIIE